MTSSSSYELRLEQAGVVVAEVSAGPLTVPAAGGGETPVDPGRPLLLRVARPPSGTKARAVMGDLLLASLRAGDTGAEVLLLHQLRDEFGECVVALEEQSDEVEGVWSTVLELRFPVAARPGLEELFAAIVKDLEQSHLDLARDVAGRTLKLAHGRRGPARILHSEQELAALADLGQRLSAALDRIGTQPSAELVRERRSARPRAVDRMDAVALRAIVSSQESRFAEGKPVSVGRIPLLRSRTTTDLAEHRHMREGILNLSHVATLLANHLRRAADLLATEEERWGGRRRTGRNVFEQRFLPRIQALAALARRADELAAAFAAMVQEHDFLASAGAPRTPFGPTPTFVSRAGYREAYRALRQARSMRGALVDEEPIKVRYRSLAQLYEYWCFFKVVEVLRARFARGEGGLLQVVDEVYRPDLAPGQRLEFAAGPSAVAVAYEPEFHPAPWRKPGLSRFRASFSEAPLRPDVVVEACREGAEPLLLVLDAKSVDRFTPELFDSVSDYRGRVHDPLTGHQPLRQVFLLHRDADAAPACSLSGYLEGRTGTEHSFVLGAVPLLPGATSALERVIDRFLEVAGIAAQQPSVRSSSQ